MRVGPDGCGIGYHWFLSDKWVKGAVGEYKQDSIWMEGLDT